MVDEKENILKKQVDFRRDTKTLCIDLEIAPRVAYLYGWYETSVLEEIRPPILLAVGWKWLGEKHAHCLSLYDRKTVDPYNDKLLVNELWNLLDEANIVCAFNGNKFDIKQANTFFVRHNMTPPSPYKQVDPLVAAKRWFSFGCNKLDHLGKLLVNEGKTETTYKDCWKDLLEGNEKEKKQASKLMNTYCARDVEVLEKVYLKVLPWMNNHPNMALYAGQPDICPRCGQQSEFKVKSYRRTGMQINAIQYQCSKCGAYVTRKLDKEEREQLKEEGKLTSVFRNMV